MSYTDAKEPRKPESFPKNKEPPRLTGNPVKGRPPKTFGEKFRAARERIPRRRGLYYFVILLTTPEPTVRPPSRIAKRRPSSIAIGAISFTPIVTLSPGITISVPDGRITSPVTSVVRK